MIKVALVGVGNCASALIQGIAYCSAGGDVALPFPVLGGYRPNDIEIVAAFDIDDRKVGRPLSEAVFALPNCTPVFHAQVAGADVIVMRGPTLDGISEPMLSHPAHATVLESPAEPMDREAVISALVDSGAQVMVNFLPVGAQKAAEFYAGCALASGLALVNAMPVFIASDPVWSARFAERGLPVLGDDFKSQFGATILHRDLVALFGLRNAQLERTYQLNVGGNTDFLNMTDRDRLETKRHSKTEAVQAASDDRLPDQSIHVGPSDHVPWLQDDKVAYIRLEGRLFGGARVDVEVRLSVTDSPNAAAMALAAIRCARIALDRKLAGAVWQPSAFLFKHPPRDMDDRAGHAALIAFAGNDAMGA